jgi:hypothetical protein
VVVTTTANDTPKLAGGDRECLTPGRGRLAADVTAHDHHACKTRDLLAGGNREQPRIEAIRRSDTPWALYLLALVPKGVVRHGGHAFRRLRSLRHRAEDSGLPPGWRVVEHRGRAAFEALEDDWRRLYEDMHLHTCFQAWEAHVAYFDLLMAEPGRFRCFALTDGRRVRAICPLEARTDTVLGPSVPVWAVPYHPHMLVADVICPTDHARRVLLPALVESLRREPENGRLLVVGPLPTDSVIWDGLRRLTPEQYCAHQSAPADVFDCEQPFDELIGRLTKHFRRNLRSHRNRLSSLAGVRFVSATEGDDLATEFEAFLGVEASGWKGPLGRGSAIGLHPELASFYQRLTTELAGHDQCEINSLYADGHCIASQFCVLNGEQYSILKIGYNEDYARIGPGLLLLEHTLERCCNDPTIKRMSLVTDGTWQRDWHPDVVGMRQAYLDLDRLSGLPLVPLLHLRFGRGRQVAHWLRGFSQHRGGARVGHGLGQHVPSKGG